MSRINFEASPDLEQTINELVSLTGSSSKSELLRRAIALMKIAAEAQQQGERIVIADQDRKPKVELQIF
ncbi:MAG: ribbon-helix-helix protein, CopG family [Crocosphaera sp.]|nr:ribbon-helix-helix protein, CopG family [Crocosphaera sp.]